MKRLLILLSTVFLFSLVMADDITISTAAWNDHTAADLKRMFYGHTDNITYVHMTTNGYLTADVAFPPDATGNVYKIFATIYDFEAKGHILLWLRKANLINGTAYTVASLSSDYSGASNAWVLYKKKASAYRAIDNTKYSFYLVAHFYGTVTNLRLGAVRINY